MILEVKSMSSCKTHSVKSKLETDSFLKTNICKFERSLLTQFKIGILPLAVEIGRYHRITLDNRNCQICCETIVKDAIHFVCYYSAYVSVMEKYFPRLKSYLDLD